MRSELTSPLGPTIESYLSLKISLGRKYSGVRDVLTHLDSFLASVGEDLTSDSYSRWVETQLHLTSGVRRWRMRIVRNLCLYRLRKEPRCFVPDLLEFPRPYSLQERIPHCCKENSPGPGWGILATAA